MDDVFHQHLDQCHQCANHPFNLCAVGARLLVVAATGLDPGDRRSPQTIEEQFNSLFRTDDRSTNR